jgi:Protein of unknown function (DUF3147)
MKVNFDFSALAKIRWYEYGIRFLFGGAITVIAGLLAKQFGPVLGGLFLAFPAIFPASATLVEEQEREKKQKAGIAKTIRGRQAAALDARGAAMGSIALACFAFLVWKLLPLWNAGLVLFLALSVWLAASVLIWGASKKVLRVLRREQS